MNSAHTGKADTPQVSVVITCYNYAPYIREAIESVLAQTWTDLEIVLVNDGSTDDSDAVIRTFLPDPRIRYIVQENSGQAHAKNRGIAEARGRFVAFLDADDIWEADKLEKQLPLFADREVGVVYSRASYIDQQSRKVAFQPEAPYLQPKSGWITADLILDNFIPFASSVVRQECFEQVGVFDTTLQMGIDWDLWLRIAARYKFDFVDEPLFRYRIGHPGQMSKKVEVRQACSDRIMEKFRRQHPGAVPALLWRKAWGYTFTNRAEHCLEINRKLMSCRYIGKALLAWPFSLRAYKILLKNLLYPVYRRQPT